MEDLPTDYTRGVDFRINKTTKGGYADYSTSKWSRKTSPLTPEQQQAIDTHGLHNLGDYLPKKPTEVELKVIEEMFRASVDGEPYDLEKFGQYYRPYGIKAPETTTPAAPVAETPAPAPAAETVEPAPAPEPVAVETAPVTPTTEAAPETGSKAEDILAMIRARQQKS
jgi:hypothetical protein